MKRYIIICALVVSALFVALWRWIPLQLAISGPSSSAGEILFGVKNVGYEMQTITDGHGIVFVIVMNKQSGNVDVLRLDEQGKLVPTGHR